VRSVMLHDFMLVYNLPFTVYCLQPWPDHAIKKEIDRLLVKCNNHEVGCGWKGLFKDLVVSCFTYYII